MAIDVIVDEGVARSDLPTEPRLRQAVEAAFREAGFDSGDFDVGLRFCSDEAVRAASKRWRGKDAVTDVLSFPLQEPPFTEDRLLGDVMMAWPRLSEDARGLGIEPQGHACHLAIHGILHLLGFTHERDDDTARMQSCESRVMRELGLHDPYGDERT